MVRKPLEDGHLISFLLKLLANRSRKQRLADTSEHKQTAAAISDKAQHNVSRIKQQMDSPSDLIVKPFQVGGSDHYGALVCIDGLVDKDTIQTEILKNILLGMPEAKIEVPSSGDAIIALLQTKVLTVHKISATDQWDEVLLAILDGETALFVDGAKQALLVDTKGWASRGVEEPQTEALIRGPRDGFTENIRTNTVHLRRRLRDPNLRFETYRIGKRAHRNVTVAYIAGIAHPSLVAEAKRRLKTVDIDDVEGSGYIEQWISDSFLSPFPQILSTERPDKVSAALLQGKIAILVDGTPFSLILPVTLANALHSPEDYYSHWFVSSLIRILRLGAMYIATFLPALYIALVEYHHGMIPSKLAFSIAGTREGVPFPAVIEAVAMEITLEILREAGVRLPRPIGQTIGIVGGLVIGEAAVSAGIVSPIMVIVVSLTAITSFAIPSYAFAMSLRIIRFAIMFAAAVFGLYGVILAYIMVNIHLVNLKSFGIPYSTPFAPNLLSDWKDLILRAPVTMMDKRPQMTQTEDQDRLGNS